MIRLLPLLLCVPLLGQDLSVARGEPNLEKRSDKALTVASGVLTAIRKELHHSSFEKIRAQLDTFREAVDYSMESLRESGKVARRNPKYFKRAEMKLRELNRRLATLKNDMSIDDRPALDELIEHLNGLQDKLVNATLGQQ